MEENGSKEPSQSGHMQQMGEASSSKDNSLPQRIVDSAIGLSSSVLNSRSLGPRLENTGLSDKGSSGPSNSFSDTTSTQGLVHRGSGSSKADRLRSEEKAGSEEAFEQFFSHPSENDDREAFTTVMPSRDVEQSSAQGFTVVHQEIRDGEEVKALLTDPASLHFTDSVDFGSIPSQLPRLRAALLGNDETSSSTWDHLLNFWPAADDNLESDKSAWLAQWKDVLAHYTDEVWGELGTDARRAKEEVEAELQRDRNDEHGLESLRRLRQILAHLRGF